ncbi:MAG: hypothetical protein KAQ62_25020 [Cyclobacteriaceae bacterium]|nr:hypothetical protein [Cyclobacteriaceae bacterium]
MLVPFEKLDPQSKIWIYQSGRKFNEAEKEFITKKTEFFLTEWTAHGHSLEAGMQIVYDQFIIIGVSEAVNEASGCSIDRSVNHIRELGKVLNIDLLERSKVAIKENAQVKLIGFSEIKKMVLSGVIHSDTEIFNNAIVSKKELESDWLQAVENSWLKRYF